MNFKIIGDQPAEVGECATHKIALILRVGLGLVFLAGGWWKLSRAIDPAASGALVEKYTATSGYINSFFDQFLFTGALGSVLTPLSFLIILSAFELIAGIALIIGLFTRGFSFIFAFLLWSFVVALPVITVAQVGADIKTHFSPAILVQIRDIGLSGAFFALLAMGSGAYSVDQKFLGRGFAPASLNWNNYGLLLRLSVAIVFIVGGIFYGYSYIKSFIGFPIALTIVGLVLASGHFTRLAAAAAFAIVLWYCFGKLSLDTSFWNNFNAIKRELAFLAASLVLIIYEGGRSFQLASLFQNPMSALSGEKKSS